MSGSTLNNCVSDCQKIPDKTGFTEKSVICLHVARDSKLPPEAPSAVILQSRGGEMVVVGMNGD